MNFRLEVVCINDDGEEQRGEVLTMERRQLAMETLGLNLSESRVLLERVQDFVVARKAAADLNRRRSCPNCGERYTSKASGTIEVKTLFGTVEVANPRWNRCQYQGNGPLGIDGGYVRAAHKEGLFEVIAGRSVVAFRRNDEDEIPAAKCFGYVQTYDQKPRRRLWEVMKSQGLQENQQVVFMSDGGVDVRRVQEYLQPGSEHWIDWFHITMRLTVLQQQTKSLMAEPDRKETGAAISKRVESVKHLLWHGNVVEVLERQAALLMELDLIRAHSPAAAKLANGLAEFETYIDNNQNFIPNFGERYRQGERTARRLWNRPSTRW